MDPETTPPVPAPEPKLPWHPPAVTKAEINHSTMSGLSSGADGSSATIL